MDRGRIYRIKEKAFDRLCKARARASDDEQNIGDGGRAKPRYRAVEIAHRRWERLNNLYCEALAYEYENEDEA